MYTVFRVVAIVFFYTLDEVALLPCFPLLCMPSTILVHGNSCRSESSVSSDSLLCPQPFFSILCPNVAKQSQYLQRHIEVKSRGFYAYSNTRPTVPPPTPSPPPASVTTCSLLSGAPLTACQAAAQPPILWDMGEDGQPCGKTEIERERGEGSGGGGQCVPRVRKEGRGAGAGGGVKSKMRIRKREKRERRHEAVK